MTAQPGRDALRFGEYCMIEQKRFGVPNEMYCYKVIGSGQANYYRPVPVMFDGLSNSGPMCDVVKVICCGVDETRVETFRLCDVTAVPATASGWQDEKPTPGKWMVSLHPSRRRTPCLPVHDCVVRDQRWVKIGNNAHALSSRRFVGAKWKRRETPQDPFLSEVQNGK